MKRALLFIYFLFLAFVLSIPVWSQECVESSCDPQIWVKDWSGFYPNDIQVGEVSRLYVAYRSQGGDLGCSGVPNGAYRIQISFPNSYSFVGVIASEFEPEYDEANRTLNLLSMNQEANITGVVVVDVAGEFVTNSYDMSSINIQIMPSWMGGCPMVFGNDVSNDVIQTGLMVSDNPIEPTLTNSTKAHTIQYNQIVFDESMEYKIFSVSGQLVAQGNDMRVRLPRGLYLLTYRQNAFMVQINE